MAQRKVNYYQIEYRYLDNTIGDVSEMFSRILIHLQSLDISDKCQRMPAVDKIFFFDSVTLVNGKTGLLFKSARHSFRPDLIDKDTFAVRTNPKRMEEGEIIKTHVVVDTNTFEAVIEASSNGMSMKGVIDYLNFYLPNIIGHDEQEGEFVLYSTPGDTIDIEAGRLNRVTVAELYVDKQILGGEALNFSNRTECVNEEIVLQLKPSERGGSIFNYVTDALGRFLDNNDRRIKRVRIKGKDEENNDILLDTLNISKKTYVSAEKNEETGEFVTSSMFESLSALL